METGSRKEEPEKTVKSGSGKLTPKQRRFVEEYLIDLNARQAAIRAGYSPRTAEVIAHQNLRKLNIAAAIAEMQQARSKRVEITQDRVLLEIARLAFFDPRKIFDEQGQLLQITQFNDDSAAAIAGMDVIGVKSESGEVQYVKKIKFWDKNSALEKLSKHLKLFGDPIGDLANSLASLIKQIEDEHAGN
jgi:phage terminase small subunit